MYSSDCAKIYVNFNYTTDYQFQYYLLGSLVMNIKFPSTRPKMPVQRNSFSSFNMINRMSMAQPSFGGGGRKPPTSKFASKTKLSATGHRGISPPIETQKEIMMKRKPTLTKSSQNCVVPLMMEQDYDQSLNIDGYLREIISGDKNCSDSLSDDNDKNHITEVDGDDEDDEEEKAGVSQNQIPHKKLSNESMSKSIFFALSGFYLTALFYTKNS